MLPQRVVTTLQLVGAALRSKETGKPYAELACGLLNSIGGPIMFHYAEG
jgi:hypothetical protein